MEDSTLRLLVRFSRRSLVVLAVAAAVLVSRSDGAPGASAIESSLPESNYWSRVVPSVVWCNSASLRTDPHTVEIHVVGRTDVASIDIEPIPGQPPFALFDDGTGGDAVAGDGVFTRANVVQYCNTAMGRYADRAIFNYVVPARVRLRNGSLLTNYGMYRAASVDARFKGAFDVKTFGGGLSATAYAFFIHDAAHEVIDGYPVATVFCGKGNYQAYKKLYSVFPDVFDIALVMPGMLLYRPGGGENVPYETAAAPIAQRIGISPVDRSADYGSAGRLKGAIYQSFQDIQVFDHELTHVWGMSLGSSLGLLEPDGVHFGALSDIGGQNTAYYFGAGGVIGHFSANSDNTWRLVPNTAVEPYAPLELYAMGLLPAEQVPPIHVLTGPNLANLEHITAASVRTVSIDQVVAAEGGPRIPSTAASQRKLDVAFIVAQDTPYNDAAYAYFSLLAFHLQSRLPPEAGDHFAPFFWATGGRAILNTRLPVALSEPTGLPPTRAVGPTRSRMPSLAVDR